MEKIGLSTGIKCTLPIKSLIQPLKKSLLPKQTTLLCIIVDLDLIAKELRNCGYCYKSSTLKPVENANVASDPNSSVENEIKLLKIKLRRSQEILQRLNS